MDSNINFTGEERAVKLLREQSLPPNFGEGAVERQVAGRFHRADFKSFAAPPKKNVCCLHHADK
jgi:hypothetical protein